MSIELERGPVREALDDLCRYRDAGNLHVLVGAGLSVPAGAPTWLGLLRKLAEQLPGDVRPVVDSRIDKRDYLKAAELIKSELGERFYILLDKIFGRDLNRAGAAANCSLLAAIPFRVRLTTNYDQLIYFHDVPVHPTNPLDFVTWEEASFLPRFIEDPDKRLLIHLHGIVNRPQTIILTREDYRDMFRRAGYRRTLEQLLAKPLLILGFGLEDADLMSTVEDLANLFDAEAPRYALVAEDQDAQQLWSRFHVTPIFYQPSEGHPEVREFLQQLVPASQTLRIVGVARQTPFMAPLPTQPFAGRDAELAHYASLLTQAYGPPVTPIAGVPGVGKTTLAIQLAQKLAPEFPDGTLWHFFANGDAAEALSAFERELGLEAIPGSFGTLAARFRREAERRRLLIVLDDVDNLERVRPLLPSQGNSRVLLTTRDASIAREFAMSPIEPLDETRSLEILAAHAGKTFVEEDRADAIRLVGFGEGLPLALEVLGKAVKDVGSLKATLKDAAAAAGHELDSLFEGVWNRLDASSQSTLCAAGLSPGGNISIEALAATLDISVVDTGRAAANLRRAGLIAEAKERLTSHPAVHKFAVNKLSNHPEYAAMRRRWSAYYVDLARQLSKQWDSEERISVKMALEQDLPCFDVLADGDDYQVESVVKELRKILYSIRDLNRSERWTRKAIEVATRLKDQRWLATNYNYAAQIYHYRGDLAEAERWLLKAIAIDESLNDQPKIGLHYNNLSQIHHDRGNLTEAERELSKAIDIAERLDDQPKLALYYNNLSQIFNDCGDLDAAENSLRKSIRICERSDKRLELAGGYNNLSQIYRARGDLDEAARWVRRAIYIQETFDDQPKLAISYNNLGMIHHMRGEFTEAEGWLWKAIDIEERLDDQPKLAIRYSNLGQIYKALGELAEAKRWLLKAIEINERIDHTLQLHALYKLARQLAIDTRQEDDARMFSQKLASLPQTADNFPE